MHRDALIQGLSDLGLKAFTLLSLGNDFSCMGAKNSAVVASSVKQPPSQCVGDYVEKIEVLQQALAPYSKALSAYNQLTLGYQKDWARFVYGVVRVETKASRLQTAIAALAAGYKSSDQYRQSKSAG